MMNNRLNHLFLALIAVALGVLVLFGRHIPVSAGVVVELGAGLAFLALYKTKRKAWSLLLGAYLLFAAGAGLLGRFLPFEPERLVPAACFMIPGAVCLLLYQGGKRLWLLRAGSFLLWLGAFLIVARWGFLWLHGAALFCLFMAAACFTVTLVSHEKGWTHRLGWLFLALVAVVVGMKALRYLFAAALLLGGIALAARALRRHGGQDGDTLDAEWHNANENNETEWDKP